MKVTLFFGMAAAAVSCAGAAELFTEPFDAEATAKVLLLKDLNAAVAYVDYGNYVRQMPGTAGPVTLKIPEAPNRLAGSAPTRGVVLSALYGGTPRAVNLPGGGGSRRGADGV